MTIEEELLALREQLAQRDELIRQQQALLAQQNAVIQQHAERMNRKSLAHESLARQARQREPQAPPAAILGSVCA